MTNNPNLIEDHVEHFHTDIKILDDYEYFSETFDCKRRPFECENKKSKGHFHCIKCDYSFTNPDEMETHICRLLIKTSRISSGDKKDISLPNTPQKECESNLSKTEEEKVSVVRAAGTFFPENSDTETMNNSVTEELQLSSPCNHSFCKLKRKPHQHCDLCNQAFSDTNKLKLHYLKHQSTDLGSLVTEKNKPGPSSINTIIQPQENEAEDLSKTSQSVVKHFPENLQETEFNQNVALQNFHLANFALQYPFYCQGMSPFISPQTFPGVQFPSLLEQPSTSIKPGSSLTPSQLLPTQFPFLNSLELAKIPHSLLTPIAELQNLRTSMKRKSETEQAFELTTRGTKIIRSDNPTNTGIKMFKDEPIPTGYLKFRFNEDCNFHNCGYRNHQSHFHCCRQDCYYSFCDKTRFVQHTARHERLDKLMGDDFKQYRANMQCGVNDCVYNKNLGKFD